MKEEEQLFIKKDKIIQFISSRKNTKYNVRKQMRDAIYFDKCRLLNNNESAYVWKDIYNQKEEVIIVLSSSVDSYYLFDYYYLRLKKHHVKINAVVQATENYCSKNIKNFRVFNIKELSDTQKESCLFIIFEIDNYNYILKLLKKYKIKRICNLFALEIKNENIFLHIIRSKRCLGKMFSEMISEYIYMKKSIQTDQTWKSFEIECSGKHLVLFGAGEGCRQFLQCYFHRFRIDAAIDNSKHQWGGTINGVNIYSPDYLYRYKQEELVILVTTLKYQSIIKQLLQMGYTNYFIFCEIEAKKFKYQINRPFYCIQKLWRHYIPVFLFYILRCIPIDQKKIVFIRHNGKGFGCHEKYITLKLLEKKLDYKIVWLVNDVFEVFPDEIIKIENTWFNRILQLVTAKFWFDDILKPPETRKRRNQYFINVWHGTGISLKKFGLDNVKEVNPETIKTFELNDKMADVYLAASKNIYEIYRRAFCYNGKILITGSPRVDILFHQDEKLKLEVKRRLGMNPDDKLMLYAPTFISDKVSVHSNKVYDLRISTVCIQLAARFGGKWKGAVRFHPFDKNIKKADCEKMIDEDIMNVTDYPDVQELLLTADVLITDYSSIMFDMCYILKKVFLFVPDLEEYLKNDRDLYFDIDVLPFPVCRNTEELMRKIYFFDEEKYQHAVKDFIKRFEVYEDGNACDRVVDVIKDFM